MYKTRKTRQNIYLLAISEAHVCNTIFKLYSLDFERDRRGTRFNHKLDRHNKTIPHE